MKISTETVFVIDDDKSVRRSLSMFLASAGYTVETCSSSEEYLAREPYEGSGCIILDVNLEGKTGLELQEELILKDSCLPIIFITGFGNISMSVNALKMGAFNFLEKPFDDKELLHSVADAITLSRKLNAEKEDNKKASVLVSALTPREYEILKYLVTGMLNKQIGNMLDIAEHTVKLHRHNICVKLGVKSVPEILRIADKAGVIPTEK